MEELIYKLKKLAIQTHYYCEDSWYSCPLADGGTCNEFTRDNGCNCGADKHNADVEKIFQEIIGKIRAASADSQPAINQQTNAADGPSAHA